MATSSRMYIYKIVPIPPKILVTSAGQLHKDYLLPVSDLDKKDGFMHMSTSTQVPKTLNRFFAAPKTSKESVYLFRVPYEPLESRGLIKWEDPSGKEGEAWASDGVFPHIYDGERHKMTHEEVESVVEVVSEEGEEGWDKGLRRVGEWLV